MAHATFASLTRAALACGSLVEAIYEQEALETDTTVEKVRTHMRGTLSVMLASIKDGLDPTIKSRTGLTGGDAAKISAHAGSSTSVGKVFGDALAASVATAEVNAAMGRIIAAPTAGASGVLPGVIITIAQEHDFDDERIVDALTVGAGIGAVFAARATLSGAAGGCQAEIGTGAAMAAGAVTWMLGGTAEQVGHAASLAMQGLLGLVCDPVAGLVEIPCVMRNATGAAVALAGAEMALAGVTFPIPLDEVVITAARVGASIPLALRETARGGLAVTKAGLAMAESVTFPSPTPRKEI